MFVQRGETAIRLDKVRSIAVGGTGIFFYFVNEQRSEALFFDSEEDGQMGFSEIMKFLDSDKKFLSLDYIGS